MYYVKAYSASCELQASNKFDSSSLQRSTCVKTKSDNKSDDKTTRNRQEQGMEAQEQKDKAAPSAGKKQQKTSKEVFFSVLPDKYEPLIEEVEEEKEETPEEKRKRKEEKKRRKKKKYKKCRKVRTGMEKFLYKVKLLNQGL